MEPQNETGRNFAVQLPDDPNDVICEVDDQGVATVTLNRPDRLNALTMSCYRRIANIVRDAQQDESVRIILFKGAGRAFSSGQDLEEAYDFYFEEGEDKRRRPSMRRRIAVNEGSLWGKGGMTETVFYSLKPTIAMVHGKCFGSGLDLLMSCDMAVASNDTEFGHPGFTYHGFGGDLASYIYHLGLKGAKKFTLTSRPFDAHFAMQHGLLTSVVPPNDLSSEVDELVADVLKMPRDAIVMQKLHYRVVLEGLGFGTNFSAAQQAIAFASNIRYESDENVMVRDRDQEGLSISETIDERRQHFSHD